VLQFVLKIVDISVALLYLYRFALFWFHHSTGICYVFFNVKGKNLAFDTSKIITNAWFALKN